MFHSRFIKWLALIALATSALLCLGTTALGADQYPEPASTGSVQPAMFSKLVGDPIVCSVPTADFAASFFGGNPEDYTQLSQRRLDYAGKVINFPVPEHFSVKVPGKSRLYLYPDVFQGSQFTLRCYDTYEGVGFRYFPQPACPRTPTLGYYYLGGRPGGWYYVAKGKYPKIAYVSGNKGLATFTVPKGVVATARDDGVKRVFTPGDVLTTRNVTLKVYCTG